jgi:hypothetical protein
MSFKVNPQVTRAGAPTVADDSSKGFVIGSAWVDTTTAPDDLYICSSSAVGAATWVKAGGVAAHPSLSTLGWSASGHTGTNNSVACFSGAGAALTAQATVDGTVLGFSGGVLQFIAIAAAVAFTDPRALDIEMLALGATTVPPSADAQVLTGSIV